MCHLWQDIYLCCIDIFHSVSWSVLPSVHTNWSPFSAVSELLQNQALSWLIQFWGAPVVHKQLSSLLLSFSLSLMLLHTQFDVVLRLYCLKSWQLGNSGLFHPLELHIHDFPLNFMVWHISRMVLIHLGIIYDLPSLCHIHMTIFIQMQNRGLLKKLLVSNFIDKIFYCSWPQPSFSVSNLPT